MKVQCKYDHRPVPALKDKSRSVDVGDGRFSSDVQHLVYDEMTHTY